MEWSLSHKRRYNEQSPLNHVIYFSILTNELGEEYIKARDEIGGGRDTKVHFDPENENSSE